MYCDCKVVQDQEHKGTLLGTPRIHEEHTYQGPYIPLFFAFFLGFPVGVPVQVPLEQEGEQGS